MKHDSRRSRLKSGTEARHESSSKNGSGFAIGQQAGLGDGGCGSGGMQRMLQKRPVARCMSLLLAFNGCWVTGGAGGEAWRKILIFKGG